MESQVLQKQPSTLVNSVSFSHVDTTHPAPEVPVDPVPSTLVNPVSSSHVDTEIPVDPVPSTQLDTTHPTHPDPEVSVDPVPSTHLDTAIPTSEVLTHVDPVPSPHSDAVILTSEVPETSEVLPQRDPVPITHLDTVVSEPPTRAVPELPSHVDPVLPTPEVLVPSSYVIPVSPTLVNPEPPAHEVPAPPVLWAVIPTPMAMPPPSSATDVIIVGAENSPNIRPSFGQLARAKKRPKLVYKCHFCPASFTKVGSLSRHLTTIHCSNMNWCIKRELEFVAPGSPAPAREDTDAEPINPDISTVKIEMESSSNQNISCDLNPSPADVLDDSESTEPLEPVAKKSKLEISTPSVREDEDPSNHLHSSFTFKVPTMEPFAQTSKDDAPNQIPASKDNTAVTSDHADQNPIIQPAYPIKQELEDPEDSNDSDASTVCFHPEPDLSLSSSSLVAQTKLEFQQESTTSSQIDIAESGKSLSSDNNRALSNLKPEALSTAETSTVSTEPLLDQNQEITAVSDVSTSQADTQPTVLSEGLVAAETSPPQVKKEGDNGFLNSSQFTDAMSIVQSLNSGLGREFQIPQYNSSHDASQDSIPQVAKAASSPTTLGKEVSGRGPGFSFMQIDLDASNSDTSIRPSGSSNLIIPQILSSSKTRETSGSDASEISRPPRDFTTRILSEDSNSTETSERIDPYAKSSDCRIVKIPRPSRKSCKINFNILPRSNLLSNENKTLQKDSKINIGKRLKILSAATSVVRGTDSHSAPGLGTVSEEHNNGVKEIPRPSRDSLSETRNFPASQAFGLASTVNDNPAPDSQCKSAPTSSYNFGVSRQLVFNASQTKPVALNNAGHVQQAAPRSNTDAPTTANFFIISNATVGQALASTNLTTACTNSLASHCPRCQIPTNGDAHVCPTVAIPEASASSLESKPFKYQCSKCEYSSSDQHEFNDHLDRHALTQRFQCPYCTFATGLKRTLDDHLVVHLQRQLFECAHCRFTTNSHSAHRRHLAAHFSLGFFKCLLCPYISSGQDLFALHLRDHADLGATCPRCPYRCPNRDAMVVHLASHLSYKLYMCPHCKFCVSNETMFNAHLGTHDTRPG